MHEKLARPPVRGSIPKGKRRFYGRPDSAVGRPDSAVGRPDSAAGDFDATEQEQEHGARSTTFSKGV
jgi:hypothetical protein